MSGWGLHPEAWHDSRLSKGPTFVEQMASSLPLPAAPTVASHGAIKTCLTSLCLRFLICKKDPTQMVIVRAEWTEICKVFRTLCWRLIVVEAVIIVVAIASSSNLLFESTEPLASWWIRSFEMNCLVLVLVIINGASYDPETHTVSLSVQFGKNLKFLFGELHVVFFPFLFPPLHSPSVQSIFSSGFLNFA